MKRAGMIKWVMGLLLLWLVLPPATWAEYLGANVSGSAFFIDTTTRQAWTLHLGKEIRVYDSANRVAVGYVGPRGTGETLGSELNGDPGFDTPAYWSTDSGWQVSGSSAAVHTTTITRDLYKSGLLPANQLYKTSLACVSYTNGSVRVGIGSGSGFKYGTFPSLEVSGTTEVGYVNGLSTTDNLCVRTFTATSNLVVDNLSVKKVLTPSTSGCSVYSTPQRKTNSWKTVATNFDWNNIRRVKLLPIRKAPVTGLAQRRKIVGARNNL